MNYLGLTLAFLWMIGVASAGNEVVRSADFLDFDHERDYSRIIRVARAARSWEIVQSGNGSNRVLRVHCRLDQESPNALIVFDLPPVSAGLIQIWAQAQPDLKSGLKVEISANDTTQSGYAFDATLLTENDAATLLTADFSQPLRALFRKGKKTSERKLTKTEQRELAVNHILIGVKADRPDVLDGEDFYVDFDLLEIFPNAPDSQ